MRFLVAALLLVCGATTALATVALHTYGWGFLLGTAATLVALLALRAGWSTRLAFGVGWVGFIAWVTPARDEGDFAVSAGLAGYGLLGLALAVLVYSLVTLPRPRRGGMDRSGSAPRMTP